jgi:hypothetical protein
MGMPPDISPANPNIQRYFISDFSGGLRLNTDSTKIQDTEYLYLKNMRNRYGRLSPVKLPTKINQGIQQNGNIQGLYGAGNFLLVIRNGLIFYRNFLDDAGYFHKLTDEFDLDKHVENVYVELVPASNQNYGRNNTGVDLTSNLSAPSPQEALVFDGKTQPLAISPQGKVRRTQTFNEWTLDSREYIPKGILPMYKDGILYVMSPNGKELFHSVTGRPQDFVIAVDENGDKIQDGLFNEEASRLSHKIDFEDILALVRIPSPDGSFLASTINNTYFVSPDRTTLVFGEPSVFNNVGPILNTGLLNPFSFVDINGDSALVDLRGIRSFNATQQLKFEGQNSQFSNNISLYFEGIIQSITAAINFDNYAFFAVTTIYGPVIMVYDTLSQVWVGLDIYPGVGQIKQFAQIKIKGIHKLFFYDSLNNVYEMFTGATAPWSFYREWSTNNPEMEQQLLDVKLIFQNITEDGSVSITDFSDRLIGKTVTKDIKANTINQDIIVPPFGDNSIDRLQNETYKFPETVQGYKTGLMVEGTNRLEVTTIEVIAEALQSITSTDQAADVYANN